MKKDEYNEDKGQVWLNVNDNFYLLHGLDLGEGHDKDDSR